MKNARNAAIPVLLFLLASVYFWTVNHSLPVPNLYMARDIRHAQALLEGHAVWFGPDLSGGGKTPGPFFYWLILPVIRIFGWAALSGFSNLLAAGAATGIWALLRRHFSPLAGFLGYCFFLGSYVVVDNLWNFWNPSFVPIFEVALIALFFNVRSLKPRSLAIAGLLAGLSLQLHMTQLVFILGALAAIALEPRVPVKRKATLAGILVGSAALSALPYALWLHLQSATLGTSHDFGAGIRTFLRPLGALFSTPGRFTALTGNLWDFARQLSGSDVFFGTCVLALPWALRSRPVKQRFLLSSLAIATPLLFWVGFMPSFKRYTLPFAVLFVIVAAIAIAQLFERSKLASRIWLGLTTLSLLVGLVVHSESEHALSPDVAVALLFQAVLCALLFWLSPKPLRKLSPVWATLGLTILGSLTFFRVSPPDYLNYQVTELSRDIVRTTRWDYEQLRQGLFIRGIWREVDLSLIYDDEYRSSPAGSPALAKVDGVIAINEHEGTWLVGEEGNLRPDWQAARKVLPEAFVDAATRGELRCSRVAKVAAFQLCYYEMKDPPAGRNWNNIGYSYRGTQPALVEARERQGVVQTAPDSAVYYLNPCGNLEEACSTFFEVTLQKGQRVRLRLLGDPVGAPDGAVNPGAAEYISKVSLAFTCNGHETQAPIPDKFGSFGDRMGFLSPFEFYLKAPCGRPSSIRLHGHSSVVVNNYTQLKGWPFDLEWNPPVH